MSLRFRRSVRLFPGVRVNFSRRGISTTVGVRGASVNLSARGAYLNAGIHGTGLSSRTRITGPEPKMPAVPAPRVATPPTAPEPRPSVYLPSGALEIKSADVSVLTSAGLGELKRLINEAAVRRHALSTDVVRKERELAAAVGRLNLARFFIVRLFTQKAIPSLAAKAQSASDALDTSRVELAGCFVQVDFGFDDATLASYAALTRCFDELRTCQRIWDITSTAITNRVAERTIATQSLTRSQVGFGYAASDIIRSNHQAMRLGDFTGRDLHFYPGFIMMRDTAQDFALIEYADLQIAYSDTRFIEEEFIPGDSQEIGRTWKKSNKDGSRDRRFNDNYQIPIMRYGELFIKSATGVLEAYMFSDPGKASDFARALDVHKRSLATLESGKELPLDGLPADEESEYALPPAPAIRSDTPKSFLLDWVGLAAVLIMLVGGGFWFGQHPVQATESPQAAMPIASAVAPKSSGKGTRVRRIRPRHAKPLRPKKSQDLDVRPEGASVAPPDAHR